MSHVSTGADADGRDADHLGLLYSLTARLVRLRVPGEVAALVLDEARAVLGTRGGAVGLRAGPDGVAKILATEGDAPPEELAAADPSVVTTPLLVDGEEVGWLSLRFDPPPPLTEATRAFVLSLASQCAVALHRARLYESVTAAHDRLEFLVHASTILATDLELAPTLARVSELAVPRLTDWCTVFRTNDRGDLEAASMAHADPAQAPAAAALAARYPPYAADAAGAGYVARTGREVVVWSMTEAEVAGVAKDAEHLAMLQALDIGATALLPLVARGRVVGVLMLINGRQRPLTADDVSLGRELAGRAAIAIDNAGLFAARTEVVRSLQSSLLPPRLPDIPGLDIGASYRQGRGGSEVGGDFYDIFAVGGGRWVVTIGDVSGKGPEAASITGLVRHTLRAVAVGEDSPAVILQRVNEVVAADERLHRPEPRYCTALVATVTPGAGTTCVRFASAGNPLPLLRGAGGRTAAVGAGGAALGLVADLGCTDVEVDLKSGEVVVFLTDGVTERRRDDKLFGEGPLQRLLGRSTTGDADALATGVIREASNFSPDEPHDDMAVVVVAVPERPSASIDLDPTVHAPAAARRFVTDTLRGWDRTEHLDATVLSVSELVTNATLHARTPIGLRLVLGDGSVRVEVRDRSAAQLEVRDEFGRAEATTGRGLRIVSELADAWGVERSNRGKVVWCEFGGDVSPSPSLAGEAGTAEPVPTRRVVIDDVSLHTLVETESHIDEVMREAQLTWGHNLDAVGEVLGRYQAFRSAASTAIRRAAGRGEERIRVELDVPVDAITDAERMLGALELADELCRSGELLALPASPEVAALLNRLVSELVQQARG